MATAARKWPVARDRSPTWFGTYSEGSLCTPVAHAIFLPQDVYIFLPSMIAVAGGGTNAMDVSKNVRTLRCTRCPARLQACCTGGGLLLLVAWASADVHQVLLQQPHVRNPIQSSRASCLGIVWLGAQSQVAAAVSCFGISPSCDGARIWCTRSLGRLNLLDFLLRHNALVGGHPGPRKKADGHLLLVDTTIEGASPSHARQE